jgi:hypothetical protein
MSDAEFLRYLKDKNAIEKLVFSYATVLDQRQSHLLTPMATDNLHFNYGGVFVTLNRCPFTTQCYGFSSGLLISWLTSYPLKG